MSERLCMIILAFEFSSTRRSVALFDEGRDQMLSVDETGNGPARMGGMIEDLLERGAVNPSQIDLVAVGLGPGSYMGIRMAISAAQGWNLATAARVMGVSSMECLAEAARRQKLRGEFDFIVDGQREEFYLGCYQVADSGWRSLAALRLAPAAEIAERIQSGKRVLGPEARRYFPAAADLFPEAADLARLAARGASPAVEPGPLEPIYLRTVSFRKAPPSRPLPFIQT